MHPSSFEEDPECKLAINRAGFAANGLAPFAFGFYLLLALQTILQQFKRVKRSRQKSHRIILIYSIAMLLLACIWFFTAAVVEEHLTVELPFNQDLKMALATCDPVATVRVLSRTMMIWLSDGIMVWRTYVIWNRQKLIAVIPVLVYLATIALGITFELSCLSTDLEHPSGFTATVQVDAALPFFALSIALTILTTSLITYKLISYRRNLRQIDPKIDDSLGAYTSLASILIESGSLYTASGVVFLVLVILRRPASIPMRVVFTCAAFISPTLIQWRVIQDTRCSEDHINAQSLPTLNDSFKLDTIPSSTHTQSRAESTEVCDDSHQTPCKNDNRV